MKTSNTQRGLSDVQLAALVESLPEGIGMLDEAAAPVWMNREARRLLGLSARLDPRDREGAALGLLIPRLVAEMPAYRTEQQARCAVEGGGVVRVLLRRAGGPQLAIWLRGSAAVDAGPARRATGERPALTPTQLIVAERLLDDAAVGLALANAAGQIRWMNRQAARLLAGGQRIGSDAERSVARAARHIASGTVAPARMRLLLPNRALDALFWKPAPHLAGVLLRDESGGALVQSERPAA